MVNLRPFHILATQCALSTNQRLLGDLSANRVVFFSFSATLCLNVVGGVVRSVLPLYIYIYTTLPPPPALNTKKFFHSMLLRTLNKMHNKKKTGGIVRFGVAKHGFRNPLAELVFSKSC